MGLHSAFLACRYAGPAMQITGKGGKEFSGGSIICTASGKSRDNVEKKNSSGWSDIFYFI